MFRNELEKVSEEHLPINHLVPSTFLCVHALDRERKGLIMSMPQCGSWNSLSQVIVVRDHVSLCNSRLWNV